MQKGDLRASIASANLSRATRRVNEAKEAAGPAFCALSLASIEDFERAIARFLDTPPHDEVPHLEERYSNLMTLS